MRDPDPIPALARPLTRLDIGVLAIAMGFPTLAAWLYFDVLEQSGLVPVFYAAGKVFQFALPIAWALTTRRLRFDAGVLGRRGLGAGFWMGLAMLAALFGLYLGFLRGSEYLEVMQERLKVKLDDFGLGSRGKFIAFAVFVSAIHSGLEEYYWRWFAFGALRLRLGFVAAAALSSLAFMAHHVIIIDSYMRPEHFWTATLVFSLGVALGGFLWSWLYERSGSILGAWLSHCLVDAGILLIGYDQVWGLFPAGA
jgi:membrane protease YdiL (CAAX protease family)